LKRAIKEKGEIVSEFFLTWKGTRFDEKRMSSAKREIKRSIDESRGKTILDRHLRIVRPMRVPVQTVEAESGGRVPTLYSRSRPSFIRNFLQAGIWTRNGGIRNAKFRRRVREAGKGETLSVRGLEVEDGESKIARGGGQVTA